MTSMLDTSLLPLREKMGGGAARMRGTKIQDKCLPFSALLLAPDFTPHPSGSACHLPPQGGKEIFI